MIMVLPHGGSCRLCKKKLSQIWFRVLVTYEEDTYCFLLCSPVCVKSLAAQLYGGAEVYTLNIERIEDETPTLDRLEDGKSRASSAG